MSEIIAIPTENDHVNAHFGRSKLFTLFKIENDIAELLKTIDTSQMQHQHGQLASVLKENNVSTAICGGIGPGAITGLENAGIKVLRGANGLIKEVAQAYAHGSLVTTDQVCDHAHDGHHHHHH